jgi:TRAP-type C4-dicarboxylate transport system permease small subunit
VADQAMAGDQGASPAGSTPPSPPAIRWIARGLDWGAGIVLFAMMTLTCVDVILRYFFHSPLSFTTDTTRLMMALVVFAVFPAISWFEEHICVDILDSFVPPGLVNLRQAAINLLAAIGFGFICERVWFIAERSASKGDLTEFSNIPVAPIYYFISILLGMTTIALLMNAARYTRGRGPMSRPPAGSV